MVNIMNLTEINPMSFIALIFAIIAVVISIRDYFIDKNNWKKRYEEIEKQSLEKLNR